MDRVNPAYVPRNHLVEEALDAATAGDLEPVHRLLEAVAAPFEERAGLERYAEPAPDELRRVPHLLRHLSRVRPIPRGVGSATAHCSG